MRSLICAPILVFLMACSVGGTGSNPGVTFTAGGGGLDTGDPDQDSTSGGSSGEGGGSSGEAETDASASAGSTGDPSGGSTSGASASTSATASGGSTSVTTGGGTTGGGTDEDPGYPKPDGSTCPAGFTLLYVLDGGSVCVLECPNDGATTCPAGQTGDADPWCSFPSDAASDMDCTMTGTCDTPGETCVEFARASKCRDDESRCGLWCGANEKTCPDGMTCAGSFCAY